MNVILALTLSVRKNTGYCCSGTSVPVL